MPLGHKQSMSFIGLWTTLDAKQMSARYCSLEMDQAAKTVVEHFAPVVTNRFAVKPAMNTAKVPPEDFTFLRFSG